MDKKVKDILEWAVCILIAVILAIAFRYYIGTPTIVQRESMYPTLIQDQKLWLSRWDRTIKKMPERGDIITFEAPSKLYYTQGEADLSNPVAKYEYEPENFLQKFVYYVLEMKKTSFIKRVIALPGEHVKIENGKVYINGEELEEDYLQPGVETEVSEEGFSEFIVPENTVFAMGDNRTRSTDCRDFGCIPLEKIEGKVVIRIWPLNLFGKVD